MDSNKIKDAVAKIQSQLPHGTITRIWKWKTGYLLIEAPEGERDHNSPYYLMNVTTKAMRSFLPHTEIDHWLKIMDNPIYKKE